MFTIARSASLGRLRQVSPQTTQNRRLLSVNVMGKAEESTSMKIKQWIKENPYMAVLSGVYLAWELSPVGPTRMMFKLFEDMKKKKSAEEARWQRIEITVPSNLQEGDFMSIQNPNFPGQAFKCQIPKGKVAGDIFKAKLPR